MIEIRHIDGTVLYTAAGAKDVRTALEEADLDGANLRGAYLRGADLDAADLSGANLRGADLSGANLRGAYLDGANLRGAYLRGAYLGGAYLRGAYLDGANLRGAYLRGTYLRGTYLDGANLRGTYLDGADLDGGVWDSVASTLKVAINAMNDGGRHWIKGKLEATLADGTAAFCSVGSVNANSEGTTRTLALWLLGQVCAGGVESFNDAPDTTWEDVQAAFALAIKHAERFAKASA